MEGGWIWPISPWSRPLEGCHNDLLAPGGRAWRAYASWSRPRGASRYARRTQGSGKADADGAAMLADPARTGFYGDVAIGGRHVRERLTLLATRDSETMILGMSARFGPRVPTHPRTYEGPIRALVEDLMAR